MNTIGRLTCALLAGSLLLPAAAAMAEPPAPELPSGWTPKTASFATKDMVVAANPLATQAGIEILRAGGSATDAAIAAQMVLNLVEPQSSGIGGGAYLLHYDAAGKKLESYDGRETAPAAADEKLFLGEGGAPLPYSTRVGGRAVGTPGVLRMLEMAWKEKGKLPWARLFAPAIRLCEQGFAISPRMFAATSGDTRQAREARLNAQPLQAPAYFYNPDGSPKPVGTLLKNPALAATFRAIAKGGADVFYKGEIARAMVAAVRQHPANPGLLSEADLAAYQARKRAPICAPYRGEWKVCTIAGASSAVAVLMTLGMLENFDLSALGPETVDSTHLIAEAYRLAYADRELYMADSDFFPVPFAGLMDKDYLQRRAALIRMDKSMGVPVAGVPPGVRQAPAADQSADQPGTSHISIVDAAGNVAAMTTTIESAFGSKQMVHGFLLNNQLTDFSFVPVANGLPVANRVEARKRPRSSMAPTIVFDRAGRVQLVIGSPGGGGIIQFVTKTLVGVIDWKLNIQDAINLGNFGATTRTMTFLERGSGNQKLQAGLEAKAHVVVVGDANSGLNGIAATDTPRRGWIGGTDPRREGLALGD